MFQNHVIIQQMKLCLFGGFTMHKRFRDILTSSNLLQIVSYSLIFAFLLNAVYIPCYIYIKNLNRSNVIASHMQQLENGMNSLNSSIAALTNLPLIVSYNADFNITYHNRSDFNNISLDDLRQTMNATMFPFDFITENGLVVENSVFFTRNRIYYNTEPLAYHTFFNWHRDSYLDEFSGSTCVLPAMRFSTIEKDFEAITIAQRFRRSNNSYFFALYPVDTLFSLFADSNMLQTCRIAFYSGDVLLAESAPPLSDNFELLTIRANNSLNLRAELQLSNSYIQQSLYGFTRLVWLFIAAIIMLSLIWIIIFSFLLWKPYWGIHNALHNLGRIQHSNSNQSFTASLVDGIAKLGEQLSDYEHILTLQQKQLRIHTFEKALYRGLYSEADRENFYNSFPNFPDKWQLIQFEYVSEDDAINPDSIQPVIIQHLQFYWNNLLFFPQSYSTLLVLIPLKQEIPATAKIRELVQNIMQQYPFSISASFSQIYNNPASLMDAAHELEYGLNSDLPSTKTNCISMPQLQTIYASLQNGDAKTAIHSLNNCAMNLFSCNDHFSVKYTYKMIDYLLLRLKLENNCINLALPSFRENDIHKLFEEDFPLCFTQIADSITQQQKKQHTQLEQDILQFIQSNLTNQQLGISMVTDHFSISAPTLQKRMQYCCQMTFSSYVETSRMKLANQLLRNTDITIQEIAISVGYTNVNSFYKAYKRLFNESPLDFRNR